MRILKRFFPDCRGASAVEFALIMPVFATMIFGTIQMGLAYYFANSVQFALERTARMTMVAQDMTESQVQAAFDGELATFTDQIVDVNYVIDTTGDIPVGEFSATYVHQVVVPFVPSFDVTFTIEERVPLSP